MSINRDSELLKKYAEIEEALSMNVKINHGQVIQVVVADLMSKYKAQRNSEYGPAFEKVLSFYLSDSEMKEMHDLINTPYENKLPEADFIHKTDVNL